MAQMVFELQAQVAQTAELFNMSVGTVSVIRQRMPNVDDCASKEEQELRVEAEDQRQKDTSVNRKELN